MTRSHREWRRRRVWRKRFELAQDIAALVAVGAFVLGVCAAAYAVAT